MHFTRMTSQVDREHSVQQDIVYIYIQLVGGGGGGGDCCTDDSALLKRCFIFLLFWRENFSLSLAPLSLLAPWHKAFLLFILQAAKRLGSSSLGTWWDCKCVLICL